MRWLAATAFEPPAAGTEYCAAEETMDPQDRGKVILRKLKAQIEYAWNHSPFYQRFWQQAGIGPRALTTLADLQRFPLVTKEVIRDDQRRHPPFGSNLCCGPAELARVHGSSGTTGSPTMFGISRSDWSRIGAAHARIMWSFGVRPSDSVFIASFFSLYLGSWGALAGTEAMGAVAFPFGAGQPGQTERAIDYLLMVRPTTFYGTPSYALHLARTARERGADPQSFGIRTMFFSGEPGAGIASTKRRLERSFNAACIDTGSTAEMTPWMSNAECAARRGMHLWDDIVYTEVVDSRTQEALTGDGEGMLVYTHLERTSQPMIRFASGDIASVASDPCPCGRTYRRLPYGIYGRTDDMLIVRGVKFYPSTVEDLLGTIPELSHEYRVRIDRPAELDVLTIEVESGESSGELAPAVAALVATSLGVRAEVRVHPVGTLAVSQFKSRRVHDARPAAARSHASSAADRGTP